MNRLNIFYHNLYSLLERMRESLNSYYEVNNENIEGSEDKAKLFADFTSEVENLIQEIDSLKIAISLPDSLELVEKFIEIYEKFISVYGDFEISVHKGLTAWSMIAKRLISIVSNELTTDFDLEFQLVLGDFKAIDLGSQLIENNFLLFDSVNFDNSIIIFSSDIDKLSAFLTDEIHSNHYDLLIIWLNFYNLTNDSTNQFVLLNKPAIPLNDLKSLLKLLVLVNGHTIKTLQKYTTAPFLPHFNKFDFSKKYNQFENISYILNEYNNHTYSLDKYLKIYHTIENFMYKIKICELQTLRGAKPITISDFQTLYESYGAKEKSAITYFFSEVGKINYDGTKTFLQLWRAQLANLETIDATMPTKIDTFLKSLRISLNYNDLKIKLDGNNMGIIVYKIRNAIVHNKDSELHLESVNLPEEARFLIEHFLIPNLEKVSFHLIINPSLIWYKDDKLLLYES